MGRQWERQLLLPFSFYIDAKVLLFFELAKFNLGRVRGLGGMGGLGGLGDEWDKWDKWDEWENYSVIVRLSFAYPSLIVRSSCIVGIGEVVEEEKLLLSSFF